MEKFRFEDLEIWKDAIETSDTLINYSDRADEKKFFRFAEQLRAASMSITNNIAEGSGSFSDREFAGYLNIARRSVFECANIIHVYMRRKIITSDEKNLIYKELISLSKRITNFRKSLLKDINNFPGSMLFALRSMHYALRPLPYTLCSPL